MKRITFLFPAILLLLIAHPLQAATLFEEDFSTSTINQTLSNGYVGGWYSSDVPFGQWVSGSHGAITAGDTLAITNTATDRSAAIVFDPAFFTATGPGEYTLRYDVTSYTGGTGDFSSVGVWAGSGYDLTETTGNALLVDTLSNSLQGVGSASASLIGSDTHTSTGTGFSIDFTWDGTSAIALFFGSDNNSGFPFPEVEFDNIELIVVPEPGSLLLSTIAFLSAGVYLSLKRKRASLSGRSSISSN